MKIEEIASKLLVLRESSSTGYLMAGSLREHLGFDGYKEAMRRRWILADDQQSGMVTITNNLGVINEMRGMAETFKKEKKCEKCEGECKCSPEDKEPANESASYAISHASRRLPVGEMVTYGLGRQPDSNTAPAPATSSSGGGSSAPAPSPTAPAAAPSAAAPEASRTAPVAIGSAVRIVQDGRQYTGRISQVKPDGKYAISFDAASKPSQERDYDKTEVSPLDMAK
jgi:hypothetical protein